MVISAAESDSRVITLAHLQRADDAEDARARAHISDVPPSSPSMALFKGSELVWFLPRHRIEGRDALAVAEDLRAAFAEHCAVPA